MFEMKVFAENEHNINMYDIAQTRERLMKKYQDGVITCAEMLVLNTIEDQVDKVIVQRKRDNRRIKL